MTQVLVVVVLVVLAAGDRWWLRRAARRQAKAQREELVRYLDEVAAAGKSVATQLAVLRGAARGSTRVGSAPEGDRR